MILGYMGIFRKESQGTLGICTDYVGTWGVRITVLDVIVPSSSRRGLWSLGVLGQGVQFFQVKDLGFLV